MNQTIKTLGFVVVAAVSIVVAAGTYYANRPVDLDDFSDVGEKFYPAFEDPNVATGLQVAAYQDETGKTELFKVDVKDGLWRIPSHHDYPADAQDRLAKTAASMVGVIRLALEERSQAAHKRYGVVDPLDKDAGTDGRGDRLTLYKGGDVLVDFIVGHKIANSENLYYVRRADETRVYTADLGRFDVSTKFSDWIKQDVLEINRNDVKDIIVGRYHVDEVQGRVVQQGKITLSRESNESDWQLTGLKTEAEKLKANEVNSLLSSLDDLKIAGVRAKPAGLSAGLKGESESISIDPLVQRDMAEKGVFISGRGEFVYNEGKVNVGLNNGVIYELGFGEEFSGNDLDIEIGKQPSPTEEAEKIAKEVEKKEDDSDAASNNEEKADDGLTKSRYLFVTAYFDKALLGPEPTAPVKPEAPAEKKEEKKEDSKESEEKPKAEGEKPEPEAKPADPQAEYKKALDEYTLQKEVYEIKKKEFEGKIAAGEKRVAELNRRFADWYYVIPEETFAKLKLKREDLVEEIKTEDKPEADQPEQTPEKPAPQMKAPAEEKSEAGANKTEEKKSDEKSEDKKPEPAKPEMEKPEASKPESMTEEPAKSESEKKEPATSEPVKEEPKTPEPEKAPEPAAETPE
ncbi:MAG TPA: DUF4340 domain-containing protein [Planctomicrobium sp.]|nr:DUF4340 domain-containing protein [Planctomicrobium sp.]